MEITKTTNYCSQKAKDTTEVYEKNNLIPFAVEERISKLINDEGLIQYEVLKKPFSTSGGSYLGDLFVVDINGKTKDGNKSIHVFIKMRIAAESLKSFLDIKSVYHQELLAYTQMGKMYNILQNEASVPEVEKFKMVKCYIQSNDDALIFENLSRKGFDMLHRMDTMSIEFAKRSIQQLAKFHALSIVLEKQKPKDFKILEDLFENPYVINDDWLSFCKNCIDSYLSMFDGDIQRRVLNFFNGMRDKMARYISGDTPYMKCFCHGDYRINNLLKREEVSIRNLVYHIFHSLPFICLIYVSSD